MKLARTTLCLALLAFFVSPLSSRAAEKPAARANADAPILQLAQTMMDAYKSKNVRVMKEILADDFIGSYDEDAWDKKEILAAVESGEDQIESMTNEDVKIRHYNNGNTAIMTGKVTAKEIYKGKDISGSHRFTIVFIRKAGKWQVASEHWSSFPIQPQK
jgi:hypothetical protein